MFTRLNILLASVAAVLFVGLVAVATLWLRTEATSTMETNDDIVTSQALDLLPSEEKLLTVYSLTDTHLWAVTEITSGDPEYLTSRKLKTWFLDTVQHRATLLNERFVSPLGIISWEFVNKSPYSPYFIARLNSVWESPLHQDMDVVNVETGELVVSTEWFGHGIVKLKKDGEELTVNWHLVEPCNRETAQSVVNGLEGDPENVVQVDGLQANDTRIPFDTRFGDTPTIRCTFNDSGAEVEYQSFGQVEFQSDDTGRESVMFNLFDNSTYALLDLDKFEPSELIVDVRGH